MEIKVYENYVIANYKSGLSSKEITVLKRKKDYLLDIMMYSTWYDDIIVTTLEEVKNELEELEINNEVIERIIDELKKMK